jgi:hypothetical protein
VLEVVTEVVSHERSHRHRVVHDLLACKPTNISITLIATDKYP